MGPYRRDRDESRQRRRQVIAILLGVNKIAWAFLERLCGAHSMDFRIVPAWRLSYSLQKRGGLGQYRR